MAESAISDSDAVSDGSLRGAIAFYFLLVMAPVAFVAYFGGLAWVVREFAMQIAG